MKMRGISYCLVMVILTGICLMAGVRGYRIQARQPPHAQLFVAFIQEPSWACLNHAAYRGKMPESAVTAYGTFAKGRVVSGGQPSYFSPSTLKAGTAGECASMVPFWGKFLDAGQKIIIAGDWEPIKPEDVPSGLWIPAYENILDRLRSNQPCPLDRALPQWRRIVEEMRGKLPEEILLRLVEQALLMAPKAHVFLNLKGTTPANQTVDNSGAIPYCHFPGQCLMPVMNRFSNEGRTMMLVSGCGEAGPEKDISSKKGEFITWGRYIRRPLRPVSPTFDDILSTLMYLAGVPLDRRRKGGVIGMIVADGLLFRRPVSSGILHDSDKNDGNAFPATNG